MNASHSAEAPPPFRLEFAGAGGARRADEASTLLSRNSDASPAVRARLAAVCAAGWSGSDPAAAAEAAARAGLIAAEGADDLAHAWARLARCAADLSPATTDWRMHAAREVLQLTEGRNETELASDAFFILAGGLAEFGLTTELDVELGKAAAEAAPGPRPQRHIAWFRAMRATLDGQTELAEQLAHDAHAVAIAENDPDADSVWMGQIAIIRWFQGHYSEVESLLLRGRQSFPGEPIWAVSLAWTWVQQGRRRAAQGLIDALPHVSEFARDRNWLSAVSILAVVATQLDKLPLAQAAGHALEPFADRVATIGLGITCWGVVARPLALVALACGDVAGAVAHYRTAIAVCARAGAHAWLAEAQAELARILATDASASARAEAHELASEAAATARAVRLHPVIEAARMALTALEVVPDTSLPIVYAACGTPSVVVLGRFEVISASGVVARWRSRKARELLKILIARRGAGIERESMMDLLWPNEDPARLANRLAVSINAARRALDPDRVEPAESYITMESGVIRLRTDRVELDAERFLSEAETALSMRPEDPLHGRRLAEVLALHTGDALVDEPDALWAERLRREVHLAFFAVSHAFAEAAAVGGDHLARIDAYQAVLSLDNFDQRAHEGLIDALAALGAHGRAAQARDAYERHMAELGLSPLPEAARDVAPHRAPKRVSLTRPTPPIH